MHVCCPITANVCTLSLSNIYNQMQMISIINYSIITVKISVYISYVNHFGCYFYFNLILPCFRNRFHRWEHWRVITFKEFAEYTTGAQTFWTQTFWYESFFSCIEKWTYPLWSNLSILKGTSAVRQHNSITMGKTSIATWKYGIKGRRLQVWP